jgi:hypothetical protein
MPQPVNAVNAKPTIATNKIDFIVIFKDLVVIGSPFLSQWFFKIAK